VPVSYEVAREGARLRASTDLPMPDALIVASAIIAGADVVVTADRSWRPRLLEVVPEVTVVLLTA
jgi:predicted nucleic acid-binding protein